MLDYRSMTDDELYFPQLFANSERQARYLAAHEPPIDHDGDTTPLHLPPAPLCDLADDDDWPAIDYTGAYDNSDEPDADANDDDLLPFEN